MLPVAPSREGGLSPLGFHPLSAAGRIQWLSIVVMFVVSVLVRMCMLWDCVVQVHLISVLFIVYSGLWMYLYLNRWVTLTIFDSFLMGNYLDGLTFQYNGWLAHSKMIHLLKSTKIGVNVFLSLWYDQHIWRWCVKKSTLHC